MMDTINALVIDNNILARERIKRVVDLLGYTIVGEAASAFEAISLSQILQPDIILMDVDMPFNDDLEAVQYFTVPVVLLYIGSTPKITKLPHTIGASAYLTGPITANKLQRAVSIATAH